MTECEFNRLYATTPEISTLSTEHFPTFYRAKPHAVSESVLIQAISSGLLYGMLEVDIEVPEKWSEGQERSLSPSEYFSEMSPIFCTNDITFEDIGPHMQEHVRKSKLSEKPRRLLVSGAKARKILLATPLLKWYLEHGLRITRIYQVIEFIPKSCFKSFENEVSNARRRGDADGMTVTAETMKLIGNSAYGGLIMQKERHQKIGRASCRESV